MAPLRCSGGTLSRFGAGLAEEFGCGPAVGDEAGGHRRRAGTATLPQAEVWSHKVVVGSPSVHLALETGGLGGGPGAAGEDSDGLAHRQVHPFYKRGLDLATPAEGAQGGAKCGPSPALQLVLDADEALLPILLVQLAAKMARRVWAVCWVRGPRTRTGMSLVRGSSASQSQVTLSQRRRRARISSSCRCGKCKAMQEMAGHSRGVTRCPIAPAGARSLPMVDDAHGGTHLQTLGQRAEYLADAGGRRLEVGECHAPACAHLGTAGLAAKQLDAVGASLRTVGDERVELRISVRIVAAAEIATGIAVGRYEAWCAASMPFVAQRTDCGRWSIQDLAWCAGLAAVGRIVRCARMQSSAALREPWHGTAPRVWAAPRQQHQHAGEQDTRQEPGSCVWHVPFPSRLLASTRLSDGMDQALTITPFVWREHQFLSGFGIAIRSEGWGVIRTPPRCPQANGVAELWARSAQRECLDRLIILRERHIHKVLAAYVKCYNERRPYQGLDPACSVPLPLSSSHGSIERREVLGGILYDHHRSIAQDFHNRPIHDSAGRAA